MKSARTALVCLLVLAFPHYSKALTKDSVENAYVRIAHCNLFRLQRPAVQQAESPPVILPKLTLTGITTILNDRRALLKARFSTQPGQPETEQLLILKEGERSEQIEIITIDFASSTVRVNNRGTPMTLTFEITPSKPSRAPIDPTPPPLPM